MGRKDSERPKGPKKSRSCTDILCLLIFLIFLGGWIGVSIIGFNSGDPAQLLYPTNSEGDICGTGYNEDRPVLFFYDLTKCLSLSALFQGCLTPQVCVSQCPDTTTSLYAFAQSKQTPVGDFTKFDPSFQRSLCVPSLSDEDWTKAVDDPTGNMLLELISTRKCPAYTLSSIAIGGRCVPDFGLIEKKNETENMVDSDGNEIQHEGGSVSAGDVWQSIKNIVEILNLQQFAERVFSDLIKSKWLLLAGLAIGLGISFLWIVLMRFFAGLMIWLSLLLTIGLLGLSTAYCWIKYDSMKDDEKSSGDIWDVNPITEDLSVYLKLRDTWLVFFIISIVLLVIILLLTIALRTRIRIAVELISESSKAVSSILSAIFYPFISFLMQLIAMAWFVVVLTYLASSHEKEFSIQEMKPGSCTEAQPVNKTCEPDTFNSTSPPEGCVCLFLRLGGKDQYNYLQIYNVFMLLWSLCFVAAMGEMVLAGAFASWYWVLRKADIPSLPVLGSLGRTLRYHTGTIAFGSFVIAVIKMIRLVLQYIQDKLEEYGADNILVKGIMCVCKCCFWCLEKFMKFINRNAYILTAIDGGNFCKSAKDAFSLILRNLARVTVVNSVTDFLLFLGKTVVTSTVAILAFYYFSGGLDTSSVPLAMAHPDLHYYFVPVFLITLGTYFIASCFFSVYSMAVDTLFLCFLLDLEQNDGSAEKPYYMSKNLMKILGLKNASKKK